MRRQTSRHAMRAVDIDDSPSLQVSGPDEALRGGPEVWPSCQEIAQRHRTFAKGITEPQPPCNLAVNTTDAWLAGFNPGSIEGATNASCNS